MISKSDYVRFIRCPRLYYLNKFCKSEATPFSLMTQNIIKHGNEIGEYGRGYFGDDYYLVDRENKSPQETVDDTLAAIKNGHKIICEASFIYKDLYCAIDILKVNDDGSVEIYEIKSTKLDQDNKYKKYYNDDIAFQEYVLTKLGYKIKSTNLLLVDKYYVFHNDLCPQKYFARFTPIKRNDVEINLNKMRAITSEPTFDPNSVCKDCSFHKHCIDPLPKPSIFEIRGNFYNYAKYKKGIKTFQDLIDHKSDFDLTMPTARKAMQQAEFEVYDLPQYVDKVGLKKWLDSLKYPIYYLDFEGIKDYMPFIEGEEIEFERPIQYSLHVQETKGGPLQHFNYLWDKPEDNTKDISEQLIKQLGTSGSILVYNQTYEKGRLKGLAKIHPEYKKELDALDKRIADLMVPFNDRTVYKKEQMGSYSIKEVLPAYCPTHKDDYHKLPGVCKGDQIETVYADLLASTGKRHKEIYDGMIEYCTLDTMSEVYVLEELYKLV